MGKLGDLIHIVEKYRLFTDMTEENSKVDDIFDYRKIIQPRHMISYNKLLDPQEVSNWYYGNAYTLMRYCHYKKKINCAIEHGVPTCYDDMSNSYEYRDNGKLGLLVGSTLRGNIIKNHTKKIIMSIGPILFYSSCIYSKADMKIVKDYLGKTLLIFPQHGLEDYYYGNDNIRFINYVKKIKSEYEFDNVLACLYFVDIKKGMHIPYEKEGFHIVSAGNRVNYDFNNCLRTIIELSDAVICHGIVSSMAYAFQLGKPVTYYEMPDSVAKMAQPIIPTIRQDLMNNFGQFSLTQSQLQRDWAIKYWGIEDHKSPEQLISYFELLQKNVNVGSEAIKEKFKNEELLKDYVVFE